MRYNEQANNTQALEGNLALAVKSAMALGDRVAQVEETNESLHTDMQNVNMQLRVVEELASNVVSSTRVVQIVCL